ncbi:MAG: lipopolysaccharide biosynthesis protein [Anaerolineaceae bacterium]|nr:MAG: lipopolysaccharide biosynthesis protein [Anaerolineaceae bacterium]
MRKLAQGETESTLELPRDRRAASLIILDVTSLLSRLKADSIFARVLRNSGFLFSSTVVSAALGFVQGILIVRLIGIGQFGALTAVMLFASNVNRLLSFRMSEVTVKYLGEALAHDDKSRAAALAKWIGLGEAFTSVLAYLVLFFLAAWFAGDALLTGYYRVYGLFLLANLVYETSTGVLQATDKFKRVASANLIQSIATISIIILAFFMHWGMFEILVAYLVGKTLAALVVTVSALAELTRKLGRGWTRASFALLPDWKSIVKFAVSTNINGTVNLFARDNIPLYINYFVSDAATGYFKIASSLINLVMLPIDPFIWPTYAEITKTIAQKQWDATRRLLKQVSLIGGGWTILAGAGLATLGWWFIPFAYEVEAAPVLICVFLLLIGYGIANIANWNRPLLLALGRPNDPLIVAAATGVIELILIVLLVPSGGYLVAAAIFSAYLAISILINVARGLSILKRNEAAA